ncbi:MAG: hypothetical protein ACKOAD_03710 [Gammaproteobacteria bacterium]
MFKFKLIKYLIFAISFIFFGIAIFIYAYETELSLKNPGINKLEARTYLISYASGADVFFKNQNTLAYSALDKGIDAVINYKPKDLELSFIEKNKKILSQPLGAGLWIWKPYILFKTMQAVPEGSIILYSDVGFILTKPLHDLLALAEKQGAVFVEAAAINPEENLIEHRVPRETLQALGMDTPEVRNKKLALAGFMLLVNNAKNRTFVEQWLNFCVTPNLIQPNKIDPKIQHPKFVANLYDMSLLSLALIKFSSLPKVFLKPEAFKDYKVWHHRHVRDQNRPLLWYMAYKTFYLNLKQKIFSGELK